jgi:diguanylate cyclase
VLLSTHIAPLRTACLIALLLALWPLAGALADVPIASPQSTAAPVTMPLIRLKGDEDGLPVALYTQVLEDSGGSMTLAQARSRTFGWAPGPADTLAFGFNRSVWWVRWQLENATDAAQAAMVDLGNARQDYVDWYVLRDDGTREEHTRSGDRVPLQGRTPVSALPVQLAPHERVDVYMRLRSDDGLYQAMPLRLFTAATYAAQQSRNSLAFGLFHGALCALVLCALLAFAATRLRAVALYALSLSCFGLASLTFRGYAFEHFWPRAPEFNNDVLPVWTGWAGAAFGLLAMDYLRLHRHAPRWLRDSCNGLVLANLMVAVPAFAGHFALARALAVLGAGGLLVATLGSGLWRLARGERAVRAFVAATALLTAAAAVLVLQLLAVLPDSGPAVAFMPAATIAAALLLALALGQWLQARKAAELAAEAHAHAEQRAVSVRLQEQVQERSRALELAHRRLSELAVIDELTGAFNHRHFHEFCSATLKNPRRDGALAFCLFDIDRFKAYNDRYGYQAGDTALRCIAASIYRVCRRSGDSLFRLSGEEFGVLFSAPSAEAAREQAERMRQALQDLSIAHADSPLGILCASFGVAWWDGEAVKRLNPERMYALADRALQAAKVGGGDRIALAAERSEGEGRALRLVAPRPPETSSNTH